MHPKHPCSSCAPCTADLRKRNLHSSAVSHKWHGCLAGILGESQSNKSEFLLLPSSSAMSKSMAFSMLWIVSGSSWDKFLTIWQKMVRWWSMEISSASKAHHQKPNNQQNCCLRLFAHPQLCGNALQFSFNSTLAKTSLMCSLVAGKFLTAASPSISPCKYDSITFSGMPWPSASKAKWTLSRCSAEKIDWMTARPHFMHPGFIENFWRLQSLQMQGNGNNFANFLRAFQSENPSQQQNPPPLPSQVQCQPRPNFWETKISAKSRYPPQFLSRNWGNSPTKGAVPGAICRQKPWTTSASWIGQNRNAAAAKKPFRLPLLHFVGTVHIAGRFRCLRNPQWRGCYSFKDLTQRKCPRFTEIKIISRSRCHASPMQIYGRGCQSNIITHRQHEMTASIGTSLVLLHEKKVPDCASRVAWQAWLGWGLQFSFLWSNEAPWLKLSQKGYNNHIQSIQGHVCWLHPFAPHCQSAAHLKQTNRFVWALWPSQCPLLLRPFQAQSEQIEMRTVGRRHKIIKNPIDLETDRHQ